MTFASCSKAVSTGVTFENFKKEVVFSSEYDSDRQFYISEIENGSVGTCEDGDTTFTAIADKEGNVTSIKCESRIENEDKYNHMSTISAYDYVNEYMGDLNFHQISAKSYLADCLDIYNLCAGVTQATDNSIYQQQLEAFLPLRNSETTVGNWKITFSITTEKAEFEATYVAVED